MKKILIAIAIAAVALVGFVPAAEADVVPLKPHLIHKLVVRHGHVVHRAVIRFHNNGARTVKLKVGNFKNPHPDSVRRIKPGKTLVYRTSHKEFDVQETGGGALVLYELNTKTGRLYILTGEGVYRVW